MATWQYEIQLRLFCTGLSTQCISSDLLFSPQCTNSAFNRLILSRALCTKSNWIILLSFTFTIFDSTLHLHGFKTCLIVQSSIRTRAFIAFSLGWSAYSTSNSNSNSGVSYEIFHKSLRPFKRNHLLDLCFVFRGFSVFLRCPSYKMLVKWNNLSLL